MVEFLSLSAELALLHALMVEILKFGMQPKQWRALPALDFWRCAWSQSSVCPG